MPRYPLVALALVLSSFVTSRSDAQTQTRRDGRLLVTVVDQSNAILPGATVTVTGLDEATRSAAPSPVPTSANGVATIPALLPGRYGVRAEFEGFEPGTLRDVRV